MSIYQALDRAIAFGGDNAKATLSQGIFYRPTTSGTSTLVLTHFESLYQANWQ